MVSGLSSGADSPNLPQRRGRLNDGDGGPDILAPTASFFGRSDPSVDGAIETSELVDYSTVLGKLWRRKLLLGLIVLLGTGAATAIVLRLPNYYTAHAFVVIGDPYAKTLPLYSTQQGGVPSLLPDTSAVQTEVEVIKSPQLAIEVIRDLKLQDNPEFNPAASSEQPGLLSWVKEQLPGSWVKDWLFGSSGAPDPQADAAAELSQTINNFLSRLRVSIKQNSRMVDIAVESGDPRLAMQITNAMADRYVANQLELRLQSAQQTSVWLKQKISKLQTKVEDAERAVEEFRSQAGLFSTPGGTPLLLKQMTDVSAELANAQTARAAVEARLSQLRSPNLANGRPNATTDVIESPLMKTLDAQEADAQQRLGEALASFGERHPTTIGLRERLRHVQAAKQNEAARIATSLENDARIAQMKERDLSDRLGRLQHDVMEMNRSEIKLRALEREAQADRLVLNNIIGRFKETGQETDASGQRPDAQIVSYAQLPVGPDRPKKGLLIVIAGFVSLIGGACLALMVERADRSLHSLAEVESVLKIAGLGRLPVSKAAQLAPCEAARYGSSYREAAKAAYSRLFCTAGAPKVTVVTSAFPAEGKTTLAASLAAMAAQGGQRVLFVDADFWKRGAGTALGIRCRSGLADVLEGKARVADAITCDVASGADVMLAGTFSRASLLAWAGKLPELFAFLKSQYDVIVIDSPPILSVAEAALIAGHADATVVAIRWASTPRDAVKTALKELRHAGATVAGSVLTLVSETEHAYYGYSAYLSQSLADYRSATKAIAAPQTRQDWENDAASSEHCSSRHALLVIDSREIFDGSLGLHSPSPYASDQLVETINGLSAVASKFGIMVIRAEREYAKFAPARFLRWLIKRFDGSAEVGIRADMRLKVGSNYSLVRSGRDAFCNSDLDAILCRHGISHLFLAGSDGVTSIAQTARSALDLDYRVTFVQDGIFTASEGKWGRLLRDFESVAAFAIRSEEFAELAEAVHKVGGVRRSSDPTATLANAGANPNLRTKAVRRPGLRREIAVIISSVLMVAAIAGWWFDHELFHEEANRMQRPAASPVPAQPGPSKTEKKEGETPAARPVKAEAAKVERPKPELLKAEPSKTVNAVGPTEIIAKPLPASASAPQLSKPAPAPSPEAATATTPAETAPLTRAELGELQGRLKGAGFDPGPIDGILGPRTIAAAHKYAEARSAGSTEPTRDLLMRVRTESAQ